MAFFISAPPLHRHVHSRRRRDILSRLSVRLSSLICCLKLLGDVVVTSNTERVSCNSRGNTVVCVQSLSKSPFLYSTMPTIQL